jgi:hypothetical protein
MVGGATSVELAREMGIEGARVRRAFGFNILKQRILEVVGKPPDVGLSHPPYHTTSLSKAARCGAAESLKTLEHRRYKGRVPGLCGLNFDARGARGKTRRRNSLRRANVDGQSCSGLTALTRHG